MGTGEGMKDFFGGIPGIPSWTTMDGFGTEPESFHLDEPDWDEIDQPDDMNRPPMHNKPRGGKGGKRGGRAGGGAASRVLEISKALSKILRHSATKEGLKLDEEGYAKVDELLKKNRFKSLGTAFPDILTVVSDNNKQRFALKPNPSVDPVPTEKDLDPSHWLIRANQGHTIAIESSALLKPLTLEAENIPEIVVHGTYFGTLSLITSTGGLKKMNRNHIHFSTALPEDRGGVVSGMRSDAEILIYMDVRKSLEEKSMLWWISDNGVVLTEGDENGFVPTKYFKRVEGRKMNVGVLWVDGKEVAPLPEGVRGRRPPPDKTEKQLNKKAARNAKIDGGREAIERSAKKMAKADRRAKLVQERDTPNGDNADEEGMPFVR